MNILHTITILNLVSLIKYSYSFKPPKHNVIAYFKTVNNVYLANPTNHTTSYRIYLAGETVNIDIPKSVANVSNIINWKVVNLNQFRLMFVHKNKPYILLNQQRIKKMNYSGELSDSIIAFGDDEALHVPTIFNPNLTKPVPKWNYIELLHFDVEKEKVSVIRSLPWLKDDDWKFIKEWKMMDYIHFDDKLYLLIKRSISKANSSSVTQEISIIRLCLDKGSELISSAVEIHYTRPEFQSNQIIEAVIKYDNYMSYSAFDFEDIYTGLRLFIGEETPGEQLIYSQHYINQFGLLFDRAGKRCASGNELSVVTLLRYHLRSEFRACKKLTYQPCFSNENYVTSFDISNEVNVLSKGESSLELTLKENALNLDTVSGAKPSELVKHQFVPYFRRNKDSVFIRIQNPLSSSLICRQFDDATICNTAGKIIQKSNDVNEAVFLQYYVNHSPLGGFYVTKVTNQIVFWNLSAWCSVLVGCVNCIMYGLQFDCVYSAVTCRYSKEVKHQNTMIVNRCFTIVSVSPLIFNSSLPDKLSIKLNTNLNLDGSIESLIIKAGPHNYCTDTRMNGPNIECSLRLFQSGKFNVEVTLRNYRYAGASLLSAVSAERVDIVAPEIESDNTTTLIILFFFAWLLSSFILIGYSKFNKEQIERVKQFYESERTKMLVGLRRLRSRKSLATIRPKHKKRAQPKPG
uniref:Uncharacterized protein n=1 Tax=Tetranychus urticae TaxID=32264 RepID=A0A158P4T6_TETUR